MTQHTVDGVGDPHVPTVPPRYPLLHVRTRRTPTGPVPPRDDYERKEEKVRCGRGSRLDDPEPRRGGRGRPGGGRRPPSPDEHLHKSLSRRHQRGERGPRLLLKRSISPKDSGRLSVPRRHGGLKTTPAPVDLSPPVASNGGSNDGPPLSPSTTQHPPKRHSKESVGTKYT